MLDRRNTTTTPADDLVARINTAIAVCNDAEKKATTARDEYLSRGRAVGVLLLEANEYH
jgi:hypothetical protein